MPIAPELRHFYRTAQWKAARKAVLERAKGECEFCGKPGNVWVCVTRDGTGRWNRDLLDSFLKGASATSYLVSELAAEARKSRKPSVRSAWNKGWRQPHPVQDDPFPATSAEPPESGRVWLIFRSLTIAHLNHVAGDDRLDNLRALCEACHLRYDRDFHKLQRSVRKDRERPLLALIEQMEKADHPELLHEALQGIA